MIYFYRRQNGQQSPNVGACSRASAAGAGRLRLRCHYAAVHLNSLVRHLCIVITQSCGIAGRRAWKRAQRTMSARTRRSSAPGERRRTAVGVSESLSSGTFRAMLGVLDRYAASAPGWLQRGEALTATRAARTMRELPRSTDHRRTHACEEKRRWDCGLGEVARG